jgi:hypothetical protein
MIETVTVRITPDGRLSRRDAAAYLDRSPKTLAEWHCKGIGPRTRRIGGRCYYFQRDLDAFIATGAREAA